MGVAQSIFCPKISVGREPPQFSNFSILESSPPGIQVKKKKKQKQRSFISYKNIEPNTVRSTGRQQNHRSIFEPASHYKSTTLTSVNDRRREHVT